MTKKPDYGIDAPKVIANLTIAFVSIILIQIAADVFILKEISPAYIIINLVLIISGLSFLITIIKMFLSSLVYKIKNRDIVLNKLEIKGNERVLDVGCGLGLYLIGAAKRLSTGHITGIDIWQAEDLSKNNKSNTEKNIKIESVAGKIDLITADMREMPFKDDSFDILVSSFAIHNLYSEVERKKALLEIIRVVKSSGKICLIDFRYIDEYKNILEQHGAKKIIIDRAKMVFPGTKVLYAINVNKSIE